MATTAEKCNISISPCSGPWHTQGWPLTHWHSSVCCCCREEPPPTEISSRKQESRMPHKPPVQSSLSTRRCKLHHTCCTPQSLHFTLKCAISCPGLATHTLAGLCALWLPSSASTYRNLQKAARPQSPQTTCPALPQHPLQAPPRLLHTEDTAFDLAVAHGIPRAVHLHTCSALRAVVVEWCLHIWKTTPAISKTAPP